MIGNRIGVDPQLIFDGIASQKREPFVLKDALIGLPELGNKSAKGKSNIEDAISGFTQIDFTYTENEFYHFINGDRKITKLYNHKNRYNNERDIEIFRRIHHRFSSQER